MTAMPGGAFADEPVPPAESAGPGLAGDQLRVDPNAYPLCIQVPAGWWRIFPLVSGGEATREYVAQLVTDPVGPRWGGRPAFMTRQPTLWRLEEALGWALPLAGHVTLQAAAPWATTGRQRARPPAAASSTVLPPAASVSLPEAGSRSDCRPWRASLVLRAHHAPATYGRLRHGEGPTRRWDHGPTSVEIVRAGPVPTTVGGGGYLLSYRVSHRGEVVFAGDDAPLAPGWQPYSTEVIRAVVTTVTTVTTGHPSGRPSDRQRQFLTAHGPALAAAARPMSHPYPPGTRIAAVVDADGAYTTGTVLATAAADRDGDRLDYLWRPDVADLPGHPWRHHPRLALRASVREVTATLDTADANTDTPDGEDAVMATGAVVATLDDPRFAVGTVLRTFAGDGPTPCYEIQPHDAPSGPVLLGATDVTPLAGTAWRTTTDLLLARAVADLDLRPFELIIAVRDYALAAEGPHGPHLAVVSELDTVDTALDPTGRVDPVDVPPLPGQPAAPTPGVIPISASGGVCRLAHPTHGLITVDEHALAAALAARPDQLAAILERHPWLPAGPHPPLVAAYLAAKHAPAALDALTHPPHPTGPGPDSPATGPPDTPGRTLTALPGGATPTDTSAGYTPQIRGPEQASPADGIEPPGCGGL
ncbi:hypothetical protein [Pseudofrankia sp. BMG5.36]|uniref:hypothetical protein n=1 Tax=Pseudofrankia sp. BMG5.36 TaxID=1834512 RepID=UPI0008D9DCCA|nr:hypothetical protein [Pseudofrankia sp. BMG5.36]OHV57984.1 hypothetical protein BCD48_42675 [Pseudofrankia sp. BMG5.36]